MYGKQFAVYFTGKEVFTGNMGECRNYMAEWCLEWTWTDGYRLHAREVRE